MNARCSGEVAEAERGATEVLEPAVDRLRRPVACGGSASERENVRGALLYGAAELADLGERRGNPAGDRVDHGLHHRLGLLLVGFAVSVDHTVNVG